MLGQACSSCGAHSSADAIHCWQCYTRFPGTGSPPSKILRGLNQRPYSSPYPPAASSSSTGFPLLIKRLALLAALSIVGWWMWTGLFGAFPFPDRISGAERIDSAPVRSGVELVEDMIAAAGLDNVDVEHAFYARDTQPTYMMFVAESDEDSVKGLLQTQARGGDRPGGSMYCSRDRAGSLCLWSQDEAVIGLYGWGEPTPVLDVSAAYIRDQLR